MLSNLRPVHRRGDVLTFPSHLPIPGAGLLPVDTYLISGAEPILIDTGLAHDPGGLLENVAEVVNLAELRWIVLTHDDRDHAGNLRDLLIAAPHATVITNGLSLARLGEERNVPAQRTQRVNAGTTLTLGGRTVSLLRPPTYDSPATLAVFDHASRALFSADGFGSVVSEPLDDAADTAEVDYLAGMTLFTHANAPWTALTDPRPFRRRTGHDHLARPGAPVQLARPGGARPCRHRRRAHAHSARAACVAARRRRHPGSTGGARHSRRPRQRRQTRRPLRCLVAGSRSDRQEEATACPMTPNRRAVLIAGLGLATGMVAAQKEATTMPATRTPLPPLDGEIRFDEQTRAAAADDFGHIVHRTPQGVLLPTSDQDVATTIGWTAGRGLSVAPKGRGHSVFGRAQVGAGIVIDMTRLRTVHHLQSDRVAVDAGATWSEVLAATLPQGLTPPVLTEYLDLSVGGTLVVGGVGAATSRFGLQSDNVLEMDVVIGTGQKITCSPTSHADLFDAARAGLGQVGVITRATLRLVPAPQQVRRFMLFYPDLPTMLQDERRLAGDNRFDAVQGAVLAAPSDGWTFRLDAVKEFSGNPPDDNALLADLSDDRSQAQPSTLPYLEHLGRLGTLEKALRSNGQWYFPHPWLTTFIGDSAVEPVVSAALAELTPADLGTFGQVVLSAFRRKSVTSPMLPLPSDDLCYAFNLVRIPTTDSLAETDRLMVANRAVYDRVRAAGGTLYPVSAFPMSRGDWRGHFGSAFAMLNDAKQKYDPDNLLTPGYEVFQR